MAILLLKSGKTGETNKDTLRRLAKDRGDTISFTKRPHFEDVLLNSNPIGRLFDSHEKAIAYLSSIARTAPAPHYGRANRSINRINRVAKKNPGVDLSPLFTKPITRAMREQILRDLRARKGTLNDAMKAAATKHGVAAIRIYTIAKQAGLTTTAKR